MSACSCPVNIPWDFSLPVTIGTHLLLIPTPPPPPPSPTAAVEMIATVAWTAGYALGRNKFTSTVLHKGGFVMLEGHDHGPLIPDVTIPPTNLWYAKMWPLSKREVKFSASTVKMNRKAAGCYTIWPPFVSICCGEPISIPFGYSVICPLNTVRVGMTWGDILAGALSIVVSVVLDIIFNKIGGGSWNPFKGVGSAVGQQVGQVTARQGLRALWGAVSKDFVRNQGLNLLKNALSGVAGCGITGLTGTGTPQLRIGLGNSWVGGEVALDYGDQHGAEGHLFGFQAGAGSSSSQTPWSNF
jgi:hypothetical protein